MTKRCNSHLIQEEKNSNFSFGKSFKLFFLLSLSCYSFNGFAQENCSNGLDDDGDGLVDLNDIADCNCEGSVIDEVGNLLSNGSFEETLCCPTGENQMYCAVDWNYATIATSDFFNLCGYMMDLIPTPFPDGDGVLGSIIQPITLTNYLYYEYITTCPVFTLLAGETYTLQFSVAGCNPSPGQSPTPAVGPIELTLYGFESCGNSNPLVSTSSCPEPFGWYVLGTVTYQPDCYWDVVSMTFTPSQDTDAIMLGAPCIVDNSYFDKRTWFLYDDMVLNKPIDPSIAKSGGTCIEDLTLSVYESDYLSYQWYYEGIALTDETSSLLNLGTVFEEGTYQVVISNPESGDCTAAETIVTTPSENTFIDFEASVISGCSPLEVSFTNLTTPDFNGVFTWDFEISSSDVTNPVISFTEEGLYSVTLTGETVDGCIASTTYENYIEVFEVMTPNISYWQPAECYPFTLFFDSDAVDDLDLIWDFGQMGTSSNYSPVISFSEEGKYTVLLEVVSNQTGCSAIVSSEIDVINNPPTFEFSAPVSICADSTGTIKAIYDNGAISWLEGGSGSSLEISAPGMYHAIFTRDDGCVAIDSIFVPLKPLPTLSATDKEACIGDAVQLYADSDAPKVYWENVSHNPVAMVYDPGIYMAIAENECGITSKEIEVVLNDCSCHIYIPNAFSPNGDGINDLFKPSISCDLQYYEMLIFDRWGGKVFATNDPEKSWNGGSLNNPDYFLEPNIYNYIIFYDNVLQPKMDRQKKTGFVQLLR